MEKKDYNVDGMKMKWAEKEWYDWDCFSLLHQQQHQGQQQ